MVINPNNIYCKEINYRNCRAVTIEFDHLSINDNGSIFITASGNFAYIWKNGAYESTTKREYRPGHVSVRNNKIYFSVKQYFSGRSNVNSSNWIESFVIHDFDKEGLLNDDWKTFHSTPLLGTLNAYKE